MYFLFTSNVDNLELKSLKTRHLQLINNLGYFRNLKNL